MIGTSSCPFGQKFLGEDIPFADKEETLRYWVIVPTAELWKLKVVDGYQLSTRWYYCVAGKADGSKLTTSITSH